MICPIVPPRQDVLVFHTLFRSVAFVFWMGVLFSVGGAEVPPAAWKTYQVWLWTFGDRDVDEGYLQILRNLGITGINREGRASSRAIRASGMTFYVGHAVGKGFLHLKNGQFQPCWDHYWKERDTRHLIRPCCLRDPEVFEKIKLRLRNCIEAQAPQAPLAYSLDDEISITRRVTPLDFCFCPHCLEGFRNWLKIRYGSLKSLNYRWRTRFEKWEAVVPMTTDEIKRREHRMPKSRWAMGPWSDHRIFMDETLATTLSALRSEARRLGVKVPVGFLGGQAPAPFGGYDWSRLVKSVDWVEAYDQGGAMEVIRGLAPDVIQVRTYFKAGKGEGANRYRLWKYFAHGDRGAILWSDREILDSVGNPSDYALGISPVLKVLTSPTASRILSLPVAHDGIALYYSQASIRYDWMVDSRPDGRTWLKRFGSHEVKHSTHYRHRRAWHRILEDAGVQYRYVDAREVAAGKQLDGVRLLVLPGVQVMESDEIRQLQAFLKRGGKILADRPGTPLRRLLSSKRAIIRRTSVQAYLDGLDSNPGDPPGLEVMVRHLDQAGIRPPCIARDENGRRGGIEVVRRCGPEGTIYFVRRNLLPEEEEALSDREWRSGRTVTVTFPDPVKAREVFGPGEWSGRTLKHEVSADRPWVFVVKKQ